MKTILILLCLALIALPGCMTAAERYAERHQYDWVADLTPDQAELLIQAIMSTKLP